jgi:Ice-binding-like
MRNIEMMKNIRPGRAMSIKPLIVATIAVSLFAFAGSAYAASPGPAPVELQSAGNFVILTKTGITDVPTSKVTGNIGTSPITGAADLLTCTEVTGSVYSDDAAGPRPCSVANPSTLTAAVLDMQAAYTDAAGRSKPDFTELGAGNIGGKTLIPGLYKWGTGVKIPTDVTLSGGPDDVWILQIAGNLIVSNGIKVHLAGGAQAKNVFWQVAGLATFGTTSHVEGIILSKTMIAVQTGASINGRLYAQTAVTLQMNTVTKPQ